MLAVWLMLWAGAPAAEAEAARGQRVFQQCYACHSVERRETGLPGPNLAGVVGRRAASRPGFDYSPAMRARGAAGLRWTEAELDRYLADPEAAVPRTSMSYVGLRNAADRRAVIAYLRSRR